MRAIFSSMDIRQSMNFWEEIANATQKREKLVVITVVKDNGSVPRRTGAKMLVFSDGTASGTVGGGLFEALVIKDALKSLDERKSKTISYSFNPEGTNPQAFGAICGGRADIFFEVIMPKDTLLIVGGGHCGRALAKMASLLDFSIIICDDREEFIKTEDFDFPNIEQTLHLPANFEGLPIPDENTYVALVSKGFVTDEAALRRVLETPAAYIGMIGSRRKRDVVFENLRKDGISEETLARVHSPIGLNIGAETPEEIAVSILAEIIQERTGDKK